MHISFRLLLYSTQNFRIGVYKNIQGNITNHFSGLLDEIRVWNIGLTEALIQERKDIPLNGDEDGLVLYLDMEDVGVGENLVLNNQSEFGDIMDASALGFNSYSPYLIQ